MSEICKTKGLIEQTLGSGAKRWKAWFIDFEGIKWFLYYPPMTHTRSITEKEGNALAYKNKEVAIDDLNGYIYYLEKKKEDDYATTVIKTEEIIL